MTVKSRGLIEDVVDTLQKIGTGRIPASPAMIAFMIEALEDALRLEEAARLRRSTNRSRADGAPLGSDTARLDVMIGMAVRVLEGDIPLASVPAHLRESLLEIGFPYEDEAA